MKTPWPALALLLSSLALADPAPWYSWMSRVDGQIVCAQTSPGPGWARLGGPYKTARCGP